jgi:hypothetical protein
MEQKVRHETRNEFKTYRSTYGLCGRFPIFQKYPFFTADFEWLKHGFELRGRIQRTEIRAEISDEAAPTKKFTCRRQAPSPGASIAGRRVRDQ